MKSLLEQSGIQESNLGSCLGPDGWIPNNDGNLIISANLTSSPDIASVEADYTKSYERVLSEAQNSVLDWRETPAPSRDQLVRDLGNALREYLESLGELILIEIGKIRVEGIDEVQEMIDICDFAVGLSRPTIRINHLSFFSSVNLMPYDRGKSSIQLMVTV